MKRYLFLLLVAASCSAPQKEETIVKDPHSFSSMSDVRIEHLSLDLEVDMEKKIISGSASYKLKDGFKNDTLYLDTRGLEILSVKNIKDNSELNFNLNLTDKIKGTALAIHLPEGTKNINIKYNTSNDAAALQWLNPEQTAGKKLPFLYTQSQAILARSWIPCQDGPGIRFTYDARVKVPVELMALMSAENPVSKNDSGIYYFRQTRAIPSYLMALAVGDIAFQSLSGNTGVYAEPVDLQSCAKEFEDLPKMMEAAESLYGKYQWGRYDVLVLPPSFPFGGMENPELTFATPTIIAGDKSLVNLVAHELAHSWSGNLVTNSTWNDFWLNEGFTVYFEKRIMEAVEGKDYSDMLQILGYQDLLETLEEMGYDNPDTRLALSLEGRDPDEGLTDIAYEKGALFLIHIERIVGREKFDPFLKKYFDSHAFGTTNTVDFIKYLENELIKGDENLRLSINADEWIYKPGLAKNLPKLRSVRLEQTQFSIEQFHSGISIKDIRTQQWSSHEWLYFIRALPSPMNASQMDDLKKNVNFAASGNSELQAAWFMHVIKNKYNKDYPALEEFLTEVGRRKFLMPLYSQMSRTPEGKVMAKEIYAKARKNYHYVSVQSIDELLNR